MAQLATEAIGLAHQSEDPMDLRNAFTVRGFVAMCQGAGWAELLAVLDIHEVFAL